MNFYGMMASLVALLAALDAFLEGESVIGSAVIAITLGLLSISSALIDLNRNRR